MANLGKSIMEQMAGLFGSGGRQGQPTKQAQSMDTDASSSPEDQQPLAERMVRKADPQKRKQASLSLKKAFD